MKNEKLKDIDWTYFWQVKILKSVDKIGNTAKLSNNNLSDK